MGPAIARYGYAGLAIGVFLESAGIPVPGETALLAAAFVAAHGTLSLPLVVVVAATAGVLGDNVGFALGRRLGRQWAERHASRLWLTPERFARIDSFFMRYGAAAVALARFVVGVRVVAAFAAGTSRMKWKVFLLFNVLGAVSWATLVSVAGYAAGRGYAGLSSALSHSGLILAVVVPAALLTALTLRYLAKHLDSIRETLRRSGAIRAMATPWVIVIGVTVAALLTFGAIAEEVAEQETSTFDNAVGSWMMGLKAPWLDGVFTLLTFAGSPLVLAALTAVLALVLLRRHSVRFAASVVTVPVLALVLIALLKQLFHRVRPDGALRYADMAYSFPSGHATGTMAIALTLAYCLTRERLAPRWSVVVALVLSLLVGSSRLYLGAHWATDVIGGWALGLAIAAGGALAYERMSATRSQGPKHTAEAYVSQERKA